MIKWSAQQTKIRKIIQQAHRSVACACAHVSAAQRQQAILPKVGLARARYWT